MSAISISVRIKGEDRRKKKGKDIISFTLTSTVRCQEEKYCSKSSPNSADGEGSYGKDFYNAFLNAMSHTIDV